MPTEVVPLDASRVAEDGAVRAVAAWLPPGAYPMSLRRKLRFAPLVGGVLRRWPTRAVRGIQALTRLEAHHPADPPHWFMRRAPGG